MPLTYDDYNSKFEGFLTLTFSYIATVTRVGHSAVM